MLREAFLVRVSGVVQGVGFRPFVKRIAVEAGVDGYVVNLGGGGVEIFLEGSREDIRRFFQLFMKRPPPAEVDHIYVKRVAPGRFNGFAILRSTKERKVRSMVPPDIGICEHCLEEIDGETRWHGYPFNSCAWCGPRFSMMYSIPYDRENTSMRDFPLCEKCISEYKDIGNVRRFHAQGISCGRCGPRLWLVDKDGRPVEGDPLEMAAKLLDLGEIVAIKGLGGFHIACRADVDEVVAKLRARKRRPYKPFAVMALNIEVASRIAHVNRSAERLLTSPQRPIVLLRRREGTVSELVAPGLDTVGVMLPYSGIHYLILKHSRTKFFIMTSGNLYNKPMEKENSQALSRLSGIADYFLLHNRAIVNRVDDSVVRFTLGAPVFLRRSRGFAPRWIRIPVKLSRPVLAFGAEIHNVGAVGFDDKVVLTQYIGDTSEYENLRELDHYMGWFSDVYGLIKEDPVVVVDKHPKYNCSMLGARWAERYGLHLYKVQHHAAHAYSILAEYGAREGVAVAIDGVGYGDDGEIWGGEILAISGDKYVRLAHLQYNKMIGGDLATIYPARMAFSFLAREMGIEGARRVFLRLGLDSFLRSREELDIVARQYSNAKTLTSSMGRFFDAVAAALGVCGYRSYEGEPAMRLEAYARGGGLILPVAKTVDEILTEEELLTSRLFAMLVEAILSGCSGRDVAYTAQYIVGYAMGVLSGSWARDLGYRSVYVTGGAAVNDILLSGLRDGLPRGMAVRINRKVPPGDGGISLGQSYYFALSSA